MHRFNEFQSHMPHHLACVAADGASVASSGCRTKYDSEVGILVLDVAFLFHHVPCNQLDHLPAIWIPVR